jgi:hypothetical protein
VVAGAVLICAQCPALACGAVLVVCGGSWWRWPVHMALSLLPINTPKIDFKAVFSGLLSLWNSRVAGNIKNALKSLILKCERSLRKHCQKNTDFQAGVFLVVVADQGMLSSKIQK